MCLNQKTESKQTKQQSKQQKTAESKRSKEVNKHTVIYNKKVKTKNKSDAASMLSQLLLKRSSAYIVLLTELKNKNKKRPK